VLVIGGSHDAVIIFWVCWVFLAPLAQRRIPAFVWVNLLVSPIGGVLETHHPLHCHCGLNAPYRVFLDRFFSFLFEFPTFCQSPTSQLSRTSSPLDDIVAFDFQQVDRKSFA